MNLTEEKQEDLLSVFYRKVFVPAYRKKEAELKKLHPAPYIFLQMHRRLWKKKMAGIIMADRVWLDALTAPYGIEYTVDLNKKNPLELNFKK